MDAYVTRIRDVLEDTGLPMTTRAIFLVFAGEISRDKISATMVYLVRRRYVTKDIIANPDKTSRKMVYAYRFNENRDKPSTP